MIHGGDRKLARALDEVAARYDPPAIFVYQTCLPGMSGDDVSATCKAAALRLNRPVIAVDAPGFAGGKLAGAKIAGDILLDSVIGMCEPAISTPTDVVLIGEYNVAGEAANITALLASAAVRVAAPIPGDGRFAEIAAAHRARVAVSHCSQALGAFTEGLSKRFDQPALDAIGSPMSTTPDGGADLKVAKKILTQSECEKPLLPGLQRHDRLPWRNHFSRLGDEAHNAINRGYESQLIDLGFQIGNGRFGQGELRLGAFPLFLCRPRHVPNKIALSPILVVAPPAYAAA